MEQATTHFWVQSKCNYFTDTFLLEEERDKPLRERVVYGYNELDLAKKEVSGHEGKLMESVERGLGTQWGPQLKEACLPFKRLADQKTMNSADYNLSYKVGEGSKKRGKLDHGGTGEPHESDCFVEIYCMVWAGVELYQDCHTFISSHHVVIYLYHVIYHRVSR